MPPRGRKPKPPEVREAEGNREKRPIRRGLKIDPVAPEPPPILEGPAREHWDYLVPLLSKIRAIGQVDLGILTAVCLTWETIVTCKEAVKRLGATNETPNGFIQSRPEAVRLDRALKQYQTFAAELGLTPSSRVRFGDKDKSGDSEADAMAAILDEPARPAKVVNMADRRRAQKD